MKKIALAFGLLGLTTFANAADVLNGSVWQTIDDETKQPKAIVKFTEQKDGSLSASIQKYLVPGQESVCTKCEGPFHNKSLNGVVIVRNLKNSGGVNYDGGSIVDPKNASIYSREYIKLNDKMLKAERKMGEKFSRIEYETNEIKDQNFSLQEKNKTLVYVFSICTLIGLFFYVYKTQQAKNRELLFKQQQQIANEDIYNLMLSQQNDI